MEYPRVSTHKYPSNPEETLTERTCVKIGVPKKGFRCIGSD